MNGADLLQALDQTEPEVAQAIGCTVQSLKRWKKGAIPGRKYRRQFELQYGIPTSAWRPPDEEPEPEPEAEIETTDRASSTQGAREHLDHIERLMQDPELTTAEALKLVGLKTTAIKTIASLEQAAEVTEDRVVRKHPHWLQIKEGMLSVLEDHPEARDAVIAMLARMEA